MNSVHIIGNLVRSPELKFTQSGKGVTNFTIAVPDRYNKENVYFIDIVVWGKTAEVCAEWLSQGKKVGITGRLTTRNWEDKNGNKRKTVEVVADEVDFLTPKGDSKPSSPPADWSNLGQEIDLGDSDESIPF